MPDASTAHSDPHRSSQEKEPSLTKAPPKGKLFPCQNCGAKVEFDPRTRSLKCPYCGHETKVEDIDAEVEERDFDEYATKLAKGTDARHRGPLDADALLRLRGDGAARRQGRDRQVPVLRHAPGEQARGGRRDAAARVAASRSSSTCAMPATRSRSGFEGLWFAPTELKSVANLGQLTGVYIPYWTYDAMTYTRYTGMRGDDYTDTETYTDRDANGNTVTRDAHGVRTNWTPVSGEVQHFFDDVLVCGSKSVPAHLVRGLEPWDTGNWNRSRTEFLARSQDRTLRGRSERRAGHRQAARWSRRSTS